MFNVLIPRPHYIWWGYEVLKLLNVLLPEVTENQNDPLVLDKESFLADRPYLIEKLAMDALPRLIQVVNSDPNTYVCHGCLSVIYKIVHFSQSDKLVELLENTNISSCLDRVFTRKDNHVLILALQIVELILQKFFSDKFIKLFIEEGVYFAISHFHHLGKHLHD
ncbi:putative aminoacyltransferase, E1 ubiquitin-activating enzyme [Medicago truncatula]|uniref:HECT-type E3 ubiquitin transferase n=1 Tax=Medicago truncatula TaxID=3880 RepID=A0A396H9E9_MEDTR|nr:putative aminoacyltransferase, E1 ubiquitin-activating enzyme [Medicago truncatula]